MASKKTGLCAFCIGIEAKDECQAFLSSILTAYMSYFSGEQQLIVHSTAVEILNAVKDKIEAWTFLPTPYFLSIL